jgi:hypothetical protein
MERVPADCCHNVFGEFRRVNVSSAMLVLASARHKQGATHASHGWPARDTLDRWRASNARAEGEGDVVLASALAEPGQRLPEVVLPDVREDGAFPCPRPTRWRRTSAGDTTVRKETASIHPIPATRREQASPANSLARPSGHLNDGPAKVIQALSMFANWNTCAPYGTVFYPLQEYSCFVPHCLHIR